MNNPRLVGGGETAGDLEGPGHGLAEGRDPAVQGFAKRLTLEELHDRVGGSVLGAEIVDRQDVGMGQGGDSPRLALETAEPVAVADQVAGKDYAAALQTIARLREPVDAFFDGVMVMAEDDEIKANRLALLTQVDALFADIADFTRIAA